MPLPKRVEQIIGDDEELRTRVLYDPILEQEVLWMGIKHLEPVNDIAPHPMFPGRVERTGPRHRHRYFGKPRTGISHRERTKNGKSHRPWRELTVTWPAENTPVEIQIRSSGMRGNNRIPNVYQVAKVWYHCDTNKKVTSVVERWRPLYT